MKKSEVFDEILGVIRKEEIRINEMEHPLKDKEMSVGDVFTDENVSKEDMFHIGCMEGQWVGLGLINEIKKIINQNY